MRIIRFVVLGLLFSAMQVGAQTPDLHYRQGLRELEDGNVAGAREEFQTAKQMQKKFAPAYVGLGLVELEKGNVNGAFELLKVARKYDKKLSDIYVAKARTYVAQGRKDWEKKALKELKQAQKLAPSDDRVPFFRGVIFRQAEKYRESVAAFGKAAMMRGVLSVRAEAAQQSVQQIQRALQNVRRSGKTIALKDQTTRADLAVLFLDEFDLKVWLSRNRSVEVDTRFQETFPGAVRPVGGTVSLPQDVGRHPHRYLIQDVVGLEVPGMELYPDGSFGPERPVTRAEFAQMIQGLLVVRMKDRELATQFFGEASRFEDLRPDHFAYNAAVLCIQRGLISARADGKFGPDQPVSGAEAILGIKKVLGI